MSKTPSGWSISVVRNSFDNAKELVWRNRITLIMPSAAAHAFEAFHYHAPRKHWDTLLSHAAVEDGGSHPFIGAVTINQGRGWKRHFAMRTRFVNYRPPYVAAAILAEPAGWFAWWAASIRHRDLGGQRSELIYTFTVKVRPRWLGWLLNPVVSKIFEYETRRQVRCDGEVFEINSLATL